MNLLIILATAFSDIPMSEIASYRGSWGERSSQGALRRYTQCRWSGHATFQLRGGTLPLSDHHPSEIFYVNAYIA